MQKYCLLLIIKVYLKYFGIHQVFQLESTIKRKDMFPELKDEDFKKYILYIISIIKKNGRR